MPRSVRRLVSAAVGAVTMLSAIAAVLVLASPATAATHEIQITDSTFGTATLTVRVGDTVTWNNVDDRPHTVTAEDGTFDSGNLDEGASFSFTFTEPGTYPYLCEYHPDMRGTIVVEPAAATATAPAAPTTTPQPAAASATPGTASHADDHAASTGSQPDTALPAPSSIPPASFLLWGLGFIGLAVGLMPVLTSARSAAHRPPGGWRR